MYKQIIAIIEDKKQVKKSKCEKSLRNKKGQFAVDFSGASTTTVKKFSSKLKNNGIEYNGIICNDYYPILVIGNNTYYTIDAVTENKVTKKMPVYDAEWEQDKAFEAIIEYSKEKQKLAKLAGLCYRDYSLYYLKSLNCDLDYEEIEEDEVVITENLIQHGFNFYAKPKHYKQVINFGKRTIDFYS